MSPYWLSRLTHSAPCTYTHFPSYFCLIPLLGTMSFPVSAQTNRVQVRPLLRITVELAMKQTSNTWNSPKYKSAGTESDISVARNDVRTWREAFFFWKQREQKAHKMADVQIGKTTTDFGQIQGLSGRMKTFPGLLSRVDDISKIISHRKIIGFLLSVLF